MNNKNSFFVSSYIGENNFHAMLETEFIDENHSSSFVTEILQNFLGGILLFDEQEFLVYANRQAISIIDKIDRSVSRSASLPQEIIHVKRFMFEGWRLFPDQVWLGNLTIFVGGLTALNVHARWINGENSKNSYLLLRMEDQGQFNQDIAIKESIRLGLTSREQEVWLLHQVGYTYKQIAEELSITPNTVKKHMKSILTKQRAGKKCP